MYASAGNDGGDRIYPLRNAFNCRLNSSKGNRGYPDSPGRKDIQGSRTIPLFFTSFRRTLAFLWYHISTCLYISMFRRRILLPAPQNLALTLKAKLFRGLSDPSRLAIVETLRSGAKTVSEIVAATKLSQPNASAHLACLRDCGLLASRQEGKYVFYALADSQMEALLEAAEHILSQVTERIACCGNYECQTAQKCVRNKQCAASVHASPLARNAAKIPLTQG